MSHLNTAMGEAPPSETARIIIPTPTSASTFTITSVPSKYSPKQTCTLCTGRCTHMNGQPAATKTAQTSPCTKHKQLPAQTSAMSSSKTSAFSTSTALETHQPCNLTYASPTKRLQSTDATSATSSFLHPIKVAARTTSPSTSESGRSSVTTALVATSTVIAVLAVLFCLFAAVRRSHARRHWRDDLEARVPKGTSRQEVMEAAVRRRKIRRALYNKQIREDELRQSQAGQPNSSRPESEDFDRVAFAQADAWNAPISGRSGTVPRHPVQIHQAVVQQPRRAQVVHTFRRDRAQSRTGLPRDSVVSALSTEGSLNLSRGVYDVSPPESPRRHHHGWPQ